MLCADTLKPHISGELFILNYSSCQYTYFLTRKSLKQSDEKLSVTLSAFCEDENS